MIDDGVEYDDDPARVDRDAVWAFLSTEAYWARWRDRAAVEAQLDSAWRLVGAYERGSGRLVGFARAFSDGVATPPFANGRQSSGQFSRAYPSSHHRSYVIPLSHG